MIPQAAMLALFPLLHFTRWLLLSCIVLSLCFCSSVQAQLLSTVQQSDSTSSATGNQIQFGTTKLASTYLFHADADLMQRSSFGMITLRQLYRGSTIRSSAGTFRDDESFSLHYRASQLEEVQPVVQSDLQVSRDSRAIGLSSLTRANLAIGSRYVVDSTQWIEAQVGAESNKLLSTQDNGGIFRVNALAANIDLEQFRLGSRLHSEFSIFPRRTNGDIDAALHLERDFDAANALHLNVNYRSLNRDWYTQILSDTTSTMLIESRLERRLSLDADLLFSITNSLFATMRLGFSQSDIGRSFKDMVMSAPGTAVSRDLIEVSFTGTAMLIWRLDHQRHELNVIMNTRDEQNTAQRNFEELSSAQLDTLQQQERIRDNAMSRSQISLRSVWEMSSNDTLSAVGSASILRYDTPSSTNDDDRDELNEQLGLSYGHRFHESLRVNLSARVQLNHLVYLKAQRSALNSWNRILQFSPSIEWTSSFLHMSPVFEILAQYAVYDFEGKAGVPSSFSFRQVSYRDSITVPLSMSVYADARVYLRYFERGELYWASFAELPQSRNYEQFLQLMLNLRVHPDITLGGGARWYALSQENLLQRDLNNSLRRSIGPECLLNLQLNKSTRLYFSGWYELQYANNVRIRTVPNMILSLRKTL